MGKLRGKERAKLPDSAFAYVDPAGRRRLPIHDEAHVRNALARFNRVMFDDETARDRARGRLLRAARRYGIVPLGFIEGQLPLLDAVRRIERRAVRNAGGFEVDARADEFFAVFARLRGIPDEHDIEQLVAADLLDGFPPLRV